MATFHSNLQEQINKKKKKKTEKQQAKSTEVQEQKALFRAHSKQSR